MMAKAVLLTLPGVQLISPQVFSDARGFSLVPYQEDEFVHLGITGHFVQEYVSHSTKNVIRGLHYQRAPHAQDKLIRCSQGDILDVVADVDQNSPTYGTHLAVRLSAARQDVLFVPGRYAHGFCVVSGEALVEYKLSDYRFPELEAGTRWNDPVLSIEWPTKQPILSERDMAWPFLPVA